MLIIDRLEGEYAVCEDNDTEQMKKLPKVMLPSGAREGDCLVLEGGQWKIDATETLRRRRETAARLDSLYN